MPNTLLEDIQKELKKRDSQILELGVELGNATSMARNFMNETEELKQQIAGKDAEIESLFKLGEKQAEEIDDLKSYLSITLDILGESEYDDIEEALESNANLEDRIAELEEKYPPECVFDALRWMCQNFYAQHCGDDPGSLVYRVSKQSSEGVPEQCLNDGLRWMLDNDPKGV